MLRIFYGLWSIGLMSEPVRAAKRCKGELSYTRYIRRARRQALRDPTHSGGNPSVKDATDDTESYTKYTSFVSLRTAEYRRYLTCILL